MRALEVARLDALMAAHWPAATRGLNDKSSAVVLRCINQRARLLGLDAPAQVNVNLQDGEVVEVGVLQVLDEEHMEMALRLRDRVAALSRLRGGASSCERPS